MLAYLKRGSRLGKPASIIFKRSLTSLFNMSMSFVITLTFKMGQTCSNHQFWELECPCLESTEGLQCNMYPVVRG